jgi:CubicO group peptidase (beta-lactamase class C family)
LESDVTTLLGEEEFTSLINSRWEAEKSWDGLTLKHLVGTTVRDLLTNSSKIDYRSGENLSGYKYQNLNFDLVGLVLEKQTGRSYAELTHELFRKAGMVNTFLHSDFPEEELFKKLRKSLKLVNRDPEVMQNVLTKAMNPSGGIISTARDLLRWNKFLGKNGYFDKLTEFAVDDGYGGRYGFGLLTDLERTFFLHDGCILFYYNGVCYAAILLHCNGINRVGFNVWETHRGKRNFSQSEVKKILDEPENDVVVEKYFRGLDLLLQKCVE